jgi:hypothetical protein
MKYLPTTVVFAMTLLVLYSYTAQANWVQTDGPEGGTIQVLLVNGSTVFAGSHGGGIFFSTNNGSTWKALNSGLTCGDVKSIAVSENTIFAGTNRRHFPFD